MIITNNQYINNSNDESQESPSGFNKTGVLLLKNVINKIEYHLYNSKIPESVDVNLSLNIHLYSVIKKPIHIIISDNNGFCFNEIGKLSRKIEDGVEKFYLETNIATFDIEMLLFNLVEEAMITIKINTVHNKEVIVDKEGRQENEPREEQS